VEAAEQAWRPLGELLVEKGLVSPEELSHALEEQEKTGRLLGAILVERRYISGPALAIALAEQYGVELNTERGFGTGLWAAIDKRHRAGRGSGEENEGVRENDYIAVNENVVQFEPTKPQLEAVPDPEPQPELESLQAENRRLMDEIERLKAEFTSLHVVETPKPEPASAHLLFVPTPARYLLVERLGPPPEPGDELEVPAEKGWFVVTKVGRSPFPGESRPCAFLVRR
jgi:hypothetical protein